MPAVHARRNIVPTNFILKGHMVPCQQSPPQRGYRKSVVIVFLPQMNADSQTPYAYIRVHLRFPPVEFEGSRLAVILTPQQTTRALCPDRGGWNEFAPQRTAIRVRLRSIPRITFHPMRGIPSPDISQWWLGLKSSVFVLLLLSSPLFSGAGARARQRERAAARSNTGTARQPRPLVFTRGRLVGPARFELATS